MDGDRVLLPVLHLDDHAGALQHCDLRPWQAPVHCIPTVVHSSPHKSEIGASPSPSLNPRPSLSPSP